MESVRPYGEALDRGVLYRMIGGRLGLEYMEASNERPVGGLRDRASAEGIHRWMNWMCLASRSRCLSFSFSFSSAELEVERDILVGVGVDDTDIRRMWVLGGIVAGRAMSAPLTTGVPDRIEGVMDRCPTWSEAVRACREGGGAEGRARGDGNDGV